jgi:hypothetical protein
MSFLAGISTPISKRQRDRISVFFWSMVVVLCLSHTVFFANGRWLWENDRSQASAPDHSPLILPGSSQGSNTNKKPTRAYGKLTIQGFSVFVDRQILKDAQQTQRLKQRFNRILNDLGKVTTAKQFATFKQTKIWLPVEKLFKFKVTSSKDFGNRGLTFKPSDTAAHYISSSVDRLKARGANPDKAHSVEIGDAAHFADYDEVTQFAIVLHEFAHAYHYQVLGEDYAPIRSAYQEAMKQKLYTMTSLRTKQDDKVYAATNADEYFAELSVAYLATNDGFPRDREILEEYDPIGYGLMRKVWGPRK